MINISLQDATHDTHDYKQIYDIVTSLPMANLVMSVPTQRVDDYIFDLVRLRFPDQCQSSHQGQSSYKVITNLFIFYCKLFIFSESCC